MNAILSPLQRLMTTWLLILATGWATLKVFQYFSELLSIFVTAGLVAFLLNYPVAKLQRFLPAVWQQLWFISSLVSVWLC